MAKARLRRRARNARKPRKKFRRQVTLSPAVASRLQDAFTAHQQGDLAGARNFYQDVLAAVPEHPDALHNLGLVHYQTGQLADAAELLAKAAVHKADDPELYLALGYVFRDLERFEEAERALKKLLRLPEVESTPFALDGRYAMGTVLQEQSRAQEAADCYQAVVDRKPRSRRGMEQLRHFTVRSGGFRCRVAVLRGSHSC